MHYSSRVFRISVILSFFLSLSLPLKADIIFDFAGNHAMYGKATAELRLKDSYQFGEDITANDLVSFKFKSKKHNFTIEPKETLTIYAALNATGKLTHTAGNYQFYLDAANNKFFGMRKDGTWRVRSDSYEGNLGHWTLRKQGFKQVCLDHDNFHKAASRGDIDYIKQCVEAGVDVNTREGNGWTALHSAAFNGRINTIRALKKLGIKKNKKDIFGHTAKDYAIKNKQYDAAAVIDQ